MCHVLLTYDFFNFPCILITVRTVSSHNKIWLNLQRYYFQLMIFIIQSTLHIVSTLYSEHFHIVNNIGETLQWRLIGIVSPYSEPLYTVNKIPLQIVFTIWRVDCTRHIIVTTSCVLARMFYQAISCF